jgi:hypothetical protein
MGIPSRLGDGDGEGCGEGDPGPGRGDVLPLGPAGQAGSKGPPRPRWTATLPVYLEGGKPYTVINRSFRAADIRADGFCGWAGCWTHEGVGFVLAPGHLTREQAAVYSAGTNRPATED